VEIKDRRDAHPLICPVCGAGLAQEGNTLRCAQSHSFDIAREGYVNLLLVKKKLKILGDTKEMLRARRAFLERGHYRPLSDAINRRVHDHLARTGPAIVHTNIAEVGCGEGQYIGRLRGRLKRDDVCYFGLDISRDAVKLAAKRHPGIRFVIAGINKRILLEDRSIQVLLNIFAPRNSTEFDRIITHDGLLLVVIPNPNHLEDLRASLGLLGLEADKRERTVEQFDGVFALSQEQSIEYEMALDQETLSNLVRMTPNAWHLTEETMRKLNSLQSAQTTASFRVLQFTRR
jgi:23S rRNA (guanine745-N1)-methyltransferase